MVGFIFRRAVALKELGERHRVDFLIRWGLSLRDWIGKFPIN